MKLTILGTPQAKQSARFRIAGKGDKQFVASYQKQSVKDTKKSIVSQILEQLPIGFTPYSLGISVSILFVYPVLKSWNKAQKLVYKDLLVYKTTKPDVDNLQKNLYDALNNTVWVDDALIAKVISIEKVYGDVPRTEIEISIL